MDKANVSYVTKARELSDRVINTGKWDTDAFLVMGMLKLLEQADAVPESDIDEYIDTSKDLFVQYMQNKTLDNLRAYMAQVRQIIFELYHTSTESERALIITELDKLRHSL